ncbi:hypothetical protein PBT90_05090 [Algoriphagus halophytocola]|uniref:hypothetical protein n=1 Tax=Algoriphagus halophytocola TaxID=2991499 RepID=UPI0022DDAD0C|nr:hypothetical protein [Algoriphagus sp. TR-M9]WBL44059.1 hypothetical protein PBT90_05090 [Algoriphagus sp. TR-M9]
MFAKIRNTQHFPNQPLFIWDGEFSFCKYWINVWKSKTEGLTYRTFQEVAGEFPDIPLKEFRKANKNWHRWYESSAIFRKISDHSYNWTAKNRQLMMKLTLAFWGKNPLKSKPYMILWVIGNWPFCHF